ncbi:STM2901 family protein [Erwinia amylovora]
MDTTEELNNTYFYAGRPNLSASELLFMIFCEKFAEQLGVDDFAAIVAILAGRNNLPTRTKPRDAIEGTSPASRGARRLIGTKKFPWGLKLPTVVGGYPPSTLRVRMTRKISTFAGRAIPVVGWLLLSRDVSEITFYTITSYNAIARGNDKIW